MNRTRKKIVSAAALCAFALSMTASGCGSTSNTSNKIALIVKSQNVDFWNDVSFGANDAAAELGYTINYYAPTNETMIDEQISMVREAIDNSVKAIVIAPIDKSKLNDVLREADSKGINVITIDSDVTYSGRKCYIGSNNLAAGEIAGRKAVDYIGESGKVAIVGHSETSSTAIERIQGFRNEVEYITVEKTLTEIAEGEGEEGSEAADPTAQIPAAVPEGAMPAQSEAQAETSSGAAAADDEVLFEDDSMESYQIPSDIHVVDLQYCSGDRQKAKEHALNMIKTIPDLDLIFATNENSTLGVCEAIDEMGMTGKINVIGFNSSDTEISYIKSGTLSGTIVQNPYQMGYLGVRYSDKAAQGEYISDNMDTGVIFIDQQNVDNQDVKLILNPYKIDSEVN